MRRREVLAAGGTVAAIALAGCSGGSADDDNSNDDHNNDADPSVEENVQNGNSRQVVVSNSGEVSADPDKAILDVAVQVRTETAPEARDELATRSEALLQALIDYGIDEDNITTQRYYIRDRIDRRAMEEDGVRPGEVEDMEEYTFYDGTHSFEVEIFDMESVGEVIDVAVDGGADDIGRITYTLSEEKQEELREEALREAIQGARSEAETIAAEVGAQIVEATVVDASEGRVRPVHRDVMMEAEYATESPDAAARTGIEAGDVTVTAQVRIQYKME